jgi:hypothetical protein
MSISEKDYLAAAAAQADEQLVQDPESGVPLDPEVAEYMGAFVQHAVSLNEVC